MRDFKGMKRQRGRNRGGNGGQGGGKPQQHNVNRSFESGGPDNVKIRGNAQHVYEKYQQLARDASSSGDRVLAENYLQHAEHYFRVIRAVQPNKPLTDIIGRDTFSGYDIDFEDESGAQAYAAEGTGEGETSNAETGAGDGEQNPQRSDRQDRGEWQPRDRQQQNDQRPRDNQRDGQRDGQQGNYNRDDRPRDGQREQRDYNRDDRPRDGQQRDNQQRDYSRDDRPRDNNQPRDNQQRDGQQGERTQRRDRFGRDRYNRDDRPARDPMAVVEPESTPLAAAPEAAPAPEERQLRSQDGSLSPAPAFLQAAPPRAVETEDGEVRKPRRRRAPKSFEGGDEAAPAPETEEA